MTTKKRAIGILLIITIMVTLLISPVPKAEAVTNFIDSGGFIEQLVKALNLEVDSNSRDPYLDAAVKAGIVKEDERIIFYFVDISRKNAAVFINRADEYLHGDTVKPELVKIIQDKRISDINKIPIKDRESVAKCFAKGIITGYSNGYYVQNRSFKGDNDLTASDMKVLINKLLNPKKRAKLSPDGMLIRTTNLPKSAKNYEYILACYPNKFYERMFEFTVYKDWKTDLDDWAYPVEMRNETFKNWYDEWPLSEEMDKYLYDWQALAEKYLHYVFNVDYRTVDDKWVDGLASLYTKSVNNKSDIINKYYIGNMKANNVVVQSSIIAVEPSTLYFDHGYCMRAYVKYRITAKNINVDQSKLIYTQYPALTNLISGEWRTGIFDIRFSTNNGSTGDGSDFSIDQLTNFIDAFNVSVYKG